MMASIRPKWRLTPSDGDSRTNQQNMDSTEVQELSDTRKSYAGIPEAQFVDDVDSFMAKEDNSNVQQVLKRLDEQHSKYRFMETNLLAKKRRLKIQIPDLEQSLSMIKLLKKQRDAGDQKDLSTKFCLSEQVYMKAAIPPTDKVCLWLGANVMLEYTLDGASELLTKNTEAAKRNLGYIEHDLNFLRDQLTTTEVNMARVFNWDVKKRQAGKQAS
ncbi:prefoldin subunit 3 [Neocloeon triangulifer]|uniref:prefoldin subunit 3 n=1 Tax=Neocloeon triangulifer TaxID=2078957 RepID=UPI00286F6920|nr:prefoldin subunit 3 [Neocloeon triangulifer]